MKKSTHLAMATALLLVTSGVALAEGDAPPNTDPDCNRVFKAKAADETKISSNQLAKDLNLPIEKVNECLLILRRAPGQAPGAAK